MDDESQSLYLAALLGENTGVKVLFPTYLFGKHYVWLKDATGHVFLESLPAPENDSE